MSHSLSTGGGSFPTLPVQVHSVPLLINLLLLVVITYEKTLPKVQSKGVRRGPFSCSRCGMIMLATFDNDLINIDTVPHQSTQLAGKLGDEHSGCWRASQTIYALGQWGLPGRLPSARTFLTQLASSGVLIIASGTSKGSTGTTAAQMMQSVDFITKKTGTAENFSAVDASRIVAAGCSCGWYSRRPRRSGIPEFRILVSGARGC